MTAISQAILAFWAISALTFLGIPMPASLVIFLGWSGVALQRCLVIRVDATEFEVRIKNKWRTVAVPWSDVDAVIKHVPIWMLLVGAAGNGIPRMWAVSSRSRRAPIPIMATYFALDDPRLEDLKAVAAIRHPDVGFIRGEPQIVRLWRWVTSRLGSA